MVSISTLKNDLDEYIARARRGESIDVVENGRVVARLGPATSDATQASTRLQQALAAGQIGLSADPDDLLEPIDASWEAAGS